MDDFYINKVRNGDLEAFGYLIRKNQKIAMRTAMSLLKNEPDAKDIVQNSFIQAYVSINKFRADAKFSTWICRIVINNSLKFIKKNKQLIEKNAALNLNPPITYNTGIRALNNQDKEILLKTALNLLAPKEALCIQLFYLEEYNIDETAKITGFTNSNIKVLLHRGRKNLLNHLNTYNKNL